MELKQIRGKKSLKLLFLLITSLLIAVVSAATYTYMYIDGSVTVGSAKLVWLKGTDAPADTTIVGGTVTMDLDVQPGYPQNFTECLFLKNQDTAAHNLTLSITTALSTTYFNEAKVHIFENSTGSWVFVDTLDMTTLDSYETYTNNDPLGAGNFYRLTFEIYAKTTASGLYAFNIQLQYQ
ncbi:MAG: hypothetical protein QXM22_06855 [Candidatus Bathyarchaeia archaeon]